MSSGEIAPEKRVRSRFCLNPDCDSYGKKYEDHGRYLGSSTLGVWIEFLCPKCGAMTIYNPLSRELADGEIAVVLPRPEPELVAERSP